MSDTRDVFVLLTKHSDNFSLFILFLIRGYYSHASIGFDDEKGKFYSFTRRGFHIEEPEKICQKRKNVKCALYKISVSQEDYDEMKKHLASFHDSCKIWKYDVPGVLMAAVRFPYWKRKYRRFCSQFVAEILEPAEEARLHKRSSIVFPDDFARFSKTGPMFRGTLEGLNLTGY
ncbi:MAG: hypothetical protein FWD27_01400 [Coriobacteriia bacterium]|nr:hypothetical protein [Coriobacteriia bacterium]